MTDGGMYKLSPEQVASKPSKKAAAVETSHGLIYVPLVMQAHPSWERIGQMRRD